MTVTVSPETLKKIRSAKFDPERIASMVEHGVAKANEMELGPDGTMTIGLKYDALDCTMGYTHGVTIDIRIHPVSEFYEKPEGEIIATVENS